MTPDHTIYMGDGSSVFVMLHVNSREGYTIAVLEAKFLGRIAKRTVPSGTPPSLEKISQPQTTLMNWRWEIPVWPSPKMWRSSCGPRICNERFHQPLERKFPRSLLRCAVYSE